MGFQSAVNKTLGTVAVAAAAGAQAKEKAAQASEQYSLAEAQKSEATAEKKELQGQMGGAIKDIDEKTKIYDDLMAKKPGGKGNTKAALEEKRKVALNDKQAAELAFDALMDKIDAKTAMIARADKIMKRTGKWGGMR